ncbi:CDP-diacylglycerol--glycerol-3-phosphate 3-phosphatidyltransferase [Propionibacterium cyclohexanicum]|uniref:CDP-diacylglycerol--glycerol-3-phosphate 3-phosphatidyltransferase n=1 Tax=Propionibacterium cyclohexanicum TaxID=64702 RepID=A0A1H9QRJ4_9ACTN|nr:CDP-diacylglycerol--glycerol-3-phosphate 3-phosphatidyltransferase [Propionibacterium cyclohexanicum]SER63221.1 CDP-diacylglycerol--glycerol-3-phosphate 3-phosphatidyltransferase [Propionibacterium cyclohexanicum]
MSTSSESPDETTTLDFAWNIPNILTITRLVLVPVFAVVLLVHPESQGWRIGAAVVFAVAILTDFVDGRLARKLHQVTNFGKIWDSVADKAITGMAFVGLSLIGELSWWITVIILLREWGITFMRVRMLRYGVMSAKRGGKLKTALQGVALTLFLLGLPVFGTWFYVTKWVFMWAAFGLTVLTGLDYLVDAARLRRVSLAAGHAIDYDEFKKHRLG